MAKLGPALQRFLRVGRLLSILTVVAISLSVWSKWSRAKEIQIVTGPTSAQQHRFFMEAAGQPDLPSFFAALTPSQKATVCKNIGAYADPKLAATIGVLLGDFDANARTILGKDLDVIAQKEPDRVADLLSLSGSFQILAVDQALGQNRASALPFVVNQLGIATSLDNSSALLASWGRQVVPDVAPLLSSSDPALRLSGADVLGKVGSRSATPRLIQLWANARGADKEAFLTAMANSGDPKVEAIMQGTALDASQSIAVRQEACVGLGHIGGIPAAKTLWNLVGQPSLDLRATVIGALQACGDAALRVAPHLNRDALRVAKEIHGALSDGWIGRGLLRGSLTVEAADAAYGRPSLVKALTAAFQRVDTVRNGATADALIRSLETTSEGRNVLQSGSWSKMQKALIGRIAELIRQRQS